MCKCAKVQMNRLCGKMCGKICMYLCVKELCRKLHQQIDAIDEQRYDMETKVAKSNKEVLNCSVLLLEMYLTSVTSTT